MKTAIQFFSLILALSASSFQAQNRTIIHATNTEISDNLDLRVVASLFGDCNDLQEFERQLNDPRLQLSNLDLNNDNQVDYLRVIESVEYRTHVVIIQSVIDRDLYQDVATIEVEKDNYNRVTVQIVGNAYLYGRDYIYEPVFYSSPRIYASFWMRNYRPYYSSWSYNYYPSYYYVWNPCSTFNYQNHVNIRLNTYYGRNNYNYVNYRYSQRAAQIYNARRADYCERQYPNYSFERRNATSVNRYEMDNRRNAIYGSSRNRDQSNSNRSESQRSYPQRNTQSEGYSQNRSNSQGQNSQRSSESSRTETPPSSQQRTEGSRNSANSSVNQRASSSQRAENNSGNTRSRGEATNSSGSTTSTRSRSEGRR